MKKLFTAIIVVVLLSSFNSFAQIKTTINLGLQFPTSDFKNDVNNGYGASLSFDYSIPFSPVSLAFSAGYNRWNFNDNNPYSKGYYYYNLPLMAGIRYFSGGSNIDTYLGGDVGLAISANNIPGSNSSSNFIYSPVLGVRYKFSPIGLVALDVNVRYNVIRASGSTTTWFGVNAGLSFGL